MTDKSEIVSFDLDEFASVDEAELIIRRPDGTPTPWVWIIAGPAHSKTLALEKRLGEEELARTRAQEQARVNGKKWKGESETVEEVKRKNFSIIAERVLGWRPAEIMMDGEPLPCTKENIIKVLSDHSRGGTLVRQLNEFFNEEKAFSKRSVKI